jgi:hypothetical protein
MPIEAVIFEVVMPLNTLLLYDLISKFHPCDLVVLSSTVICTNDYIVSKIKPGQ